jgi:hypothetical protein
MSSRKPTAELGFRFAINPQDSSLTKAKVQKLLAKATAEAEAQAQADGFGFEAKTGLEGGFLGIGEATALLILVLKSGAGAKIVGGAVVGGKIVGKAALEGIGAGGGKLFFDKYLAPRLRNMNLLPTKFEAAEKAPTVATPKKTERRKKG